MDARVQDEPETVERLYDVTQNEVLHHSSNFENEHSVDCLYIKEA